MKELKDLFSCIEEIKADTVALSNTSLLIKEKILSERREKRIYAAYIIGLVAKLRQNQGDLKKDPYLIQLNYYLKCQGLIYSLENQVLLINFEKFKREIKNLMDMVLKIEQSGNHPGAQRFIDTYSVMSPELTLILKKAESIPIDIKVKTTRQKNQSE
jgi:hypothetical protein